MRERTRLIGQIRLGTPANKKGIPAQAEEAIAGKVIYYSVDGFGIMQGFTPSEEASPSLVETMRPASRG